MVVAGQGAAENGSLALIEEVSVLFLRNALVMHRFRRGLFRQGWLMSAHLETPEYVGDRIEKLLTIDDVARVLGISRGSVYRLMRSGELLAIRIGERARFEPTDVRAYLERHREVQPDE